MHEASLHHYMHEASLKSIQSLNVLIIGHPCLSLWYSLHEASSHIPSIQSLNDLIIDHPCLSLSYSLHVALLHIASSLPVIECSDHRSSMLVTVIQPACGIVTYTIKSPVIGSLDHRWSVLVTVVPVPMISMFARIQTGRKAANQSCVCPGNTSPSSYGSMHTRMVMLCQGKLIFDSQLFFQSKCVQRLPACNICVMQILCTQMANAAELLLESLSYACHLCAKAMLIFSVFQFKQM